MLDLKIVNGRVVDGSGSPFFRADIGIQGDTIVSIGDLSTTPSRQTMDAREQVVAPGFIDLLGWSQSAAFVDPNLEGKIRQGVTTEITGEGHSPAPVNKKMIEASGGTPPEWETLGQYMTALEKNRSAINFAFFVGASNPRSMIIGPIKRDPTEAEMLQMEQIIDQAMREGAIGISTSLIYVPAVFSKTEEIVRLAKVAAKHEGVYFSHIRNEADQIIPALEEAFRIGREANIPVNIWHLKIGGVQNHGRMPEVIAKIDEQRRAGLDVAANVYPYIASSTSLTALAPDWSLEGGYAEFLKRLDDPEQRAKIIAAVRESGFYNRVGGANGVLITRVPDSNSRMYERKRLDEIGRMMNLDPMEALVKLYQSSTLSPSAIYFSMNEEDVKYALKQPWVSVGADSGAVVGEGKSAGAHPRAYGTFPRVIGHYVRDEKLFTLEEAVRKITSQAAARVKIWDRGLLRPGFKADLVIFDPATVRDTSTYEDPHHFSEGINGVIVNGTAVLNDGKMTGALPGRVIRGKGAKLERERR